MAVQTRDLFEAQLKERVPPVLSDGTPLSELVNLDRRAIKMRALVDPELHRLELQKIWAKVWIPICHETDLPKVGDYRRGYIGEDPVIVTRAQDGSINVLLNVCSHRGMEICWGDEGNSATFKCPYHGWVFDGTGKLLGAPFEREMYGDWDKSEFPLRTAKVASRHGVYFATFNPNPPSLEDFLTEFVGMFDFMFGSHEMVTVGDQTALARMSIMSANWKVVAEQNSGDGYHTVTLHHSLFETGFQKGGDMKGWALDCYDMSSTGGHGLRIAEIDNATLGVAGEALSFPYGWFIAGSMFPSVSCGMSARYLGEGTDQVPMWSARLGARAPYGHGSSTTSGFGVSVVNKEAADRMAEMVAKSPTGQRQIRGGGGVINLSDTDDPESWMSETRAARGVVAQEETIKYNALLGASEPEEFPKGLGLVHRGFSKDDNQWHFWLAYYDWMTRD
jgi:nitrite reductase/ring-hydroxylating ferredoxin subunit